MLKTKAPRYNTANQVVQSSAATHLWEDFVKQVGAYARRVNLTYRNVPMADRFEARRTKQDIATAAWYNKNSSTVR